MKHFCVKMEIMEGLEIKMERLADINVALDMSQDFLVRDFVSRDPSTGKVSLKVTLRCGGLQCKRNAHLP